MYRAIRMNVGVFVPVVVFFTLDFYFSCTTAANRTHRPVSYSTYSTYSISISLTRMSVPPVGCTW